LKGDPIKKNNEVFKDLDLNTPKGALNTCFSLLQKLITNIVNKPTEQKFRTIKTTNPKLMSSVFNVLGIEIILTNLGFALESGDYVFKGNDTKNLSKTLILLDAKLMQLNAPVSTGDPEILKRNNEMLMKKKANEEEQRRNYEAMAKGNKADKEAQ